MDFKNFGKTGRVYGPYPHNSPLEVDPFKNILYSGFIPKKDKINIHLPKFTPQYSLNFLKQLEPSEPQHSLIIGDLLGQNGKHGYGDLFLKEFFNLIVNDDKISYESDEKWDVSVEKERYDIRIRNRNNTKIVIIENKSNWADDQPNQLYRYWLNGIYSAQFNLMKYQIPYAAKIIYLSPSFEKRYTEQSITRPYDVDINFPLKVPEEIIKIVFFKEEIVSWLKKCQSLVENTSEMYFYIKQYLDFWR
jgi:hypothetical protein